MLCVDQVLKHLKLVVNIVIRADSLETPAELAVLRTYVDNQVIPEPILLYWTSKCKLTKEQGSEDCLWSHIFGLILSAFFLFYVKMQTKQDQTVL